MRRIFFKCFKGVYYAGGQQFKTRREALEYLWNK